MGPATRAVAVALLLLGASVGCSCSRDDDTDKSVPTPGPVVLIELRNGWSDPGTDPAAIAGESARARAKGNPEVADVLLFYSDVSRAAGDVLSVVTTVDGRAALAVRRHSDTATPLDQAVARVVAEAKKQGGVLTAAAVTFHAVPAWEVVHTGVPAGQRDVTYWFDRAGGRFTVEISGAAADVTALADAVRVT